MKTRFTLLVPVYNRPELVRETIESVFAQTFRDYELVVIDDGSTDNTPGVLKSYGNRITFIQQANQGPEAARLRAASMTDSDYFVLLDSDDLLLPHSLATYDRIIRQLNAPPVIIGSLLNYHTGEKLPAGFDTETVEVNVFASLFARDRPIGTTCSQMVVKRSAMAAAGAWRPKATAFPFDTADMLLSLSMQGPWVVVHRPVTIAYRLHGTNTIGNLPRMVQSAPVLLRLELAGKYPGGISMQFARWAYLGGVMWNWCALAFRARRFGLAMGLVVKSAPMIACGVLRKVTLKFRRRQSPQRLAP